MKKRVMPQEEKVRWKWAKDWAVVIDALDGRTDSQNGHKAVKRLVNELMKMHAVVYK